jgi:hypothetical protein
VFLRLPCLCSRVRRKLARVPSRKPILAREFAKPNELKGGLRTSSAPPYGLRGTEEHAQAQAAQGGRVKVHSAFLRELAPKAAVVFPAAFAKVYPMHAGSGQVLEMPVL